LASEASIGACKVEELAMVGRLVLSPKLLFKDLGSIIIKLRLVCRNKTVNCRL
jgi:hypothetical protein